MYPPYTTRTSTNDSKKDRNGHWSSHFHGTFPSSIETTTGTRIASDNYLRFDKLMATGVFASARNYGPLNVSSFAASYAEVLMARHAILVT